MVKPSTSKRGRPKAKKKRCIPDKAKTTEEKFMIKNVHQWVSEAITRERLGEIVFNGSRDKLVVTSEICGSSRATIHRIITNEGENKECDTRGKIIMSTYNGLL